MLVSGRVYNYILHKVFIIHLCHLIVSLFLLTSCLETSLRISLDITFSYKNPGQTFHAYTKLTILPGSSKVCLTWFRYRVSIHHPLRFNWHPDWKVLVYTYYSLRIQLCPKKGISPIHPILFGWDVSTINPIRSGGVWILTVDG